MGTLKTDYLVAFIYAFYRGNRPGEPVGWGIAALESVWKDVACTGDEDYLHECEFKETNRYCGYRSPQVLCDVPFRFTESEGK